MKFPQPTAAFKPGTGKVAVIACALAAPPCKLASQEVVKAAKAAGWTPEGPSDGQFNPTTQANLVQKAVQQKVDAIVLWSIDVHSIKAAVDAALKARIPVACGMCASGDYQSKPHFYDVTSGGYEGNAIAYWAADQAGSKGKIQLWNDPAFPIIGIRVREAKKVLSSVCASCSVSTGTMASAELTKPGPPTWTAFLQSHPKGSINVSVFPADSWAVPAAKTATQTGRTEIGLAGYDASPDFLKAIAAGTSPAATTAEPFYYAAWGTIDQVARDKAGKPKWASEHLPYILVDKNNVQQFVNGPGFFEPKDFDYRAMFKKLWQG